MPRRPLPVVLDTLHGIVVGGVRGLKARHLELHALHGVEGELGVSLMEVDARVQMVELHHVEQVPHRHGRVPGVVHVAVAGAVRVHAAHVLRQPHEPRDEEHPPAHGDGVERAFVLAELERAGALLRKADQVRPVDDAAFAGAHEVGERVGGHAVAPDHAADLVEGLHVQGLGRVLHALRDGVEGLAGDHCLRRVEAEGADVALHDGAGDEAAFAAVARVQGADVRFVHYEDVCEVLERGEVESGVRGVARAGDRGKANVDVHAAAVGDEGAEGVGVGAAYGVDNIGDFNKGFRMGGKDRRDKFHAVGIP